MRERVLVVEADPEAESRLGPMLLAIAPEAVVEWVDSAEEALRRIRSAAEAPSTRGYDLVLSEIFLESKATGIDLWSACEQEHPQLPILLMSRIPVQDFYHALGADVVSPPYLPKPFTLAECGQVIDSMLKHGKRRGALPGML